MYMNVTFVFGLEPTWSKVTLTMELRVGVLRFKEKEENYVIRPLELVVVQLIAVLERAVIVQGTPPILTEALAMIVWKLLPLIVTGVPPVEGPRAGEMEVTTGVATTVYLMEELRVEFELVRLKTTLQVMLSV